MWTNKIAKVSLNFKKLTKWFVSGGSIKFYKNKMLMVDEVPHITHEYMSLVNGLGKPIMGESSGWLMITVL